MIKPLLLTSIFLVNSTLNNYQHHNANINKTALTDDVHQFAQKYENLNLNPQTISYYNIWLDLTNSYLINTWSSIKFHMVLDQTKAYWRNIWKFGHFTFLYDKQQWPTSKVDQFTQQYENGLTNSIQTLLSYNFIISVASDIAYYYAAQNHSTHSENCISNALNVLTYLKLAIQKDSASDNCINLNGNFMTTLNNFNVTNLINDYEKQTYDGILEKYRILNYNLTMPLYQLTALDHAMYAIANNNDLHWDHNIANNLVPIAVQLSNANALPHQPIIYINLTNNFGWNILTIPNPYGGGGGDPYVDYNFDKPRLLDLTF